MQYIAHKLSASKIQLLKCHLKAVAKTTKNFSRHFCSTNLSYYIGLLHDIGKYSDAFQRRINGSNEKVDHSTAGLQLVFDKFPPLISNIMGYCISGHHSGLLDYGTEIDIGNTLLGRKKKQVEDYSAYKEEISFSVNIDTKEIKKLLINTQFPDFSISFYIRMLYSSLVDADFLDTEKFMNGNVNRQIEYNFSEMFNKLLIYIRSFENKKGLINEKRREILKQCLKYGDHEQGIYRLAVPTGGGKTISSLAFAFKQLLNHKLDKIIYVIPYTSIIEQTATIFKKIFGDNMVLEHHYNIEYGDENSDGELSEEQKKLKLATQNWDYPIIVTTNVQFFESLFSNKSSKCRKLHNIANSVIIFDEVQMFPYHFLKPCMLAIEELVYNYKTTVLLCSATQPNYSSIININIKDIIGDYQKLNQVFRRVKVVNIGKIGYSELIDKVKNYKQVLTIVNTRKMALQLFQTFKNFNRDGFCLSTLLTPNDRKKAIKEIKERLKKNQNCHVFSTQIIEAGVDIDFPIVYRSLAGIDSIVQSAGRCNREGKLKCGMVNIFSLVGEKNRKSIEKYIGISNMIIAEGEDILSIKTINKYYDAVFLREELDEEKILNCFVNENGKKKLEMRYNFEEAAGKFKLIDSNQIPIIIPNESNEKDIKKLQYVDNPRKLLNKLQQDTVLIYKYEFEKLFSDHKIRPVIDGIFVLVDKNIYDRKIGLNVFYGDDFEPMVV